MRITLTSSDPIMNIGIAVGGLLFVFLSFLFCIYIVSLFRPAASARSRGRLPPISIIIPAHNEERGIMACLRAVDAAKYPAKREIIIVDDGSTDTTAELCRTYAKGRKDVRVLRQGCSGKVVALNNGVRAAKHGIIVCVDADVRISRETLLELVGPFSDPGVGATNAMTFIDRPRGLLGNAQAVEYSLNNLIRSSFARVFRSNIWFYGAVAAYRRSALDRRAPFKRRSLTEDMDICLELFARGHRVVACERAAAYTGAETSLRRLVRQRMRWFYGALQALHLHRRSWKRGMPAPVVFLYANQWWWTVFSFVFFPLTAYQVWFWWPGGAWESTLYVARWFSIVGPFYVLSKTPEWGISALNIFGVLAGLITLIMTLGAFARFRKRLDPANPLLTLIAVAFYFPYTIIMNASIVFGVAYYRATGARYFKK